ncbi:hypothetical protein GCM10010343_48900 [Streptomyces avidinii]|nr:hypothetical protein GCM10010343_48900 [Streptomyces avidinii]
MRMPTKTAQGASAESEMGAMAGEFVVDTAEWAMAEPPGGTRVPVSGARYDGGGSDFPPPPGGFTVARPCRILTVLPSDRRHFNCVICDRTALTLPL